MISYESKLKIKSGAKKSAQIQKDRKQQRIIDYNLDPKKCKICSKNISYDKRINKFCSRSCSSKFNNIGIRRHGSGAHAKKPCLFCEKITKNIKYCSYFCNTKHKWNQKKAEIELNGFLGIAKNYCTPRKYLFETRGHKCEICNNIEWNGKSIPLVLDHINGHSEDWRLENVRLICPNCDAQTPTYKGKNIGNGRAYRRQRYAEGKSF